MDKEKIIETALESLATYFASHKQVMAYRRNLVAAFDEAELHTLCFDIGIDYELLPGAHKGIKVVELISYCLRHGRLFDLLTYCAEARPHLFTKPDSASRTHSIQTEQIPADEVYKTIASRNAADDFANLALQRFADQPSAESSRTILQAILREQLETDPEFAQLLQSALSNKLGTGDVITQTITLQDNASARDINLIGKIEG